MKVTCPCGCEYTFEAKRSDKGARYAKRQSQLNEIQIKVLCAWLSSPCVKEYMTKKELCNRLGFAFGTIGGRVSEFVTLELVENKKTNVEGRRSLYKLKLDRAVEILNADGKLR